MELKVTVNKCNFHKESKGGYWCLVSTDAGTVKGEMAWVPQPDERLKLTGDWVVYQGQKQFEFNSALPDIPEDPKARLHYTCQLAEGIGPATEEKIWEAKGEDWQQLEDGEVKGVRGDKYQSFIESIELVKYSEDHIQVVGWLTNNIGATWNLAEAAFTEWGKETIGVIKNDVYQLAYLPNYSFKDADKFRDQFGIGETDPRRIRAAVYYVLNQNSESGNTVMTWDSLKTEFKRFVGNFDKVLAEEVGKMFQEAALKGWSQTRKLATAEDHENENNIYQFVNKG